MERAELFIKNGDVARARARMESGPEVVYRILGWQSGDFSFTRSDEAMLREIAESTEGLILEGMKRLDEWERVEADGPDMQIVLRQQASVVNRQYDQLSPEAQQVLRLVDARRTVATLVRESGLESVQALAAVTELMMGGVVAEWTEAQVSPEVILAEGRLPEARGGIEFSSATFRARSGGRPPRR